MSLMDENDTALLHMQFDNNKLRATVAQLTAELAAAEAKISQLEHALAREKACFSDMEEDANRFQTLADKLIKERIAIEKGRSV